MRCNFVLRAFCVFFLGLLRRSHLSRVSESEWIDLQWRAGCLDRQIRRSGCRSHGGDRSRREQPGI